MSKQICTLSSAPSTSKSEKSGEKQQENDCPLTKQLYTILDDKNHNNQLENTPIIENKATLENNQLFSLDEDQSEDSNNDASDESDSDSDTIEDSTDDESNHVLSNNESAIDLNNQLHISQMISEHLSFNMLGRLGNSKKFKTIVTYTDEGAIFKFIHIQ